MYLFVCVEGKFSTGSNTSLKFLYSVCRGDGVVACHVLWCFSVLWLTLFPSDIDGDGIISRKDVYEVLDMLTDTNMCDEEKDQIINGVYI